MKSFYTVLILFLIMALAIGINYVYIGRLSQELITECEAIREPSSLSAERAEKIHTLWHAHRKYVQITANHTEIEAIDNAIDTLVVRALGESVTELQEAKRLAINALEELRSAERLTLIGIL